MVDPGCDRNEVVNPLCDLVEPLGACSYCSGRVNTVKGLIVLISLPWPIGLIIPGWLAVTGVVTPSLSPLSAGFPLGCCVHSIRVQQPKPGSCL